MIESTTHSSTPTIDIDDSDDESVAETHVHESSHLLGEDLYPRYATASPLPSIRPRDEAPKDFWTTFRTRAKYYFPVLQWMPTYSFNLFTGDLLAGLTLSCLMIPQALSYATALCKLEAVHGLYAIAFPAITYALFGMSRQLSMGPEASLSMLVGSAIAAQQHLEEDDDPMKSALAISCLLTLFVGIFTFLLGIFRLGFLDSLMSRALLRGFITAVAIVVMVQQSITLLGLVELSEDWGISEASSTIDRLVFLAENITQIHVLTATVSAVACLVLFGARVIKAKFPSIRWLQLLPEVLLVVVASIILTGIWRWDLQGLQVLGDIKASGIPLPSIPDIPHRKHFKDVALTAGLISMIGFVESIVISKTFSSKHNYTVSANRELVAMGAANIMGGLFQGIPAFGSVARSKINDRAGARTQMAGLITGIIALLAILFLLPYLYYLPKAVLSSVIFIAVLYILFEAPEDIQFMLKIGAWRDITLFCLTFLATVVISLEFGTLLAVALSLLLTVKETSYPRITIMGRVKGTHNKFRPIKDGPDFIEHIEDVLIVRIEEPLFFANTGQLKDRLRRLEVFGDMSIHPSESPRLRDRSFIIFDVSNMPEIDASAVQILYEIVASYRNRAVEVYFVKLRDNALELFIRSGLLEFVGRDHTFKKVSEAIAAVEKAASNRPLVNVQQ
ncbi:sulfate transporter family-domain-containing protein [Umbelopsis sp. PMI_123]|nr:sulfate transporter family-domain-containing protein [Umbelopsis sp. PMI_123]